MIVGGWIVCSLCVLCGASGCAGPVVGFPFVQESWLGNAIGTGTAVRYKGWGICLDTYALEGGVTWGLFDKTYYFPGPASSFLGPRRSASEDDHATFDLSEAATLLDDFALEPLEDPDQLRAHKACAFEPIGVRSARAGLSVEVNPHRVSISIGLQRRSALVLNVERDVRLIWINSSAASTKSPSRSQLHLISAPNTSTMELLP